MDNVDNDVPGIRVDNFYSYVIANFIDGAVQLHP